MHCIKIILCALLLVGSVNSAALAGEKTSGSKMFGCFDMEWEVTPDQQANVHFSINDQILTRFTLGPNEPFRQFYLSSENNIAEGRMRIRYKPAKGKAYLQMDSFIYRCASPNERSFSGILAEFELPVAETPDSP